jgi:hypothetical protein
MELLPVNEMQEGNIHKCYTEAVKRKLLGNWDKVVGIVASFVCFQQHWPVPTALERFLLAKVLLKFSEIYASTQKLVFAFYHHSTAK